VSPYDSRLMTESVSSRTIRPEAGANATLLGQGHERILLSMAAIKGCARTGIPIHPMPENALAALLFIPLNALVTVGL